MTKAEAREIAQSIVELYSASMKIDEKAVVRKGKKEHLDPELEPTQGFWVECQVFVPADWGAS